MQKVHQNQWWPLFGTAKLENTSAAMENRSLALIVISAFFVVLAAALAMRLALGSVGSPEVQATVAPLEEVSAVMPGALVSGQLQKGYIGK